MNHDSFSSGDSLIHVLNPRFKTVIAILFSFLVAVSQQFSTLCIALSASILLVLLSRLNLILIVKRLTMVSGMILICWIILPFSMKGEILMPLGPFNIYQSGIELSLRISLKSYTIVLAVITLVSTVSTATLGHVLDWLRLPEKLILLFILTYRYLFVLEQEYQRLLTAAKIRCFQPKNNLHTYKTYAYLIGMLFVRASIRGEQVYKAMLCRGFKGKFYSIHKYSTTYIDILFLTVAILSLTALGLLEWGTTIISSLT